MNSIETFAEARNFVFDTIIEAEDTVTGLTVSKYVPTPGNARSPVAIVDINGGTISPVEFQIPVRAYVDASSAGVDAAQEQVAGLVDAIETLLAGESLLVQGQVAYVPANDVWVADLAVTVPRAL